MINWKQHIESNPDTRIFFMNGEVVIVKEDLEEIQKIAANFYKSTFGASAAFSASENVLQP